MELRYKSLLLKSGIDSECCVQKLFVTSCCSELTCGYACLRAVLSSTDSGWTGSYNSDSYIAAFGCVLWMFPMKLLRHLFVSLWIYKWYCVLMSHHRPCVRILDSDVITTVVLTSLCGRKAEVSPVATHFFFTMVIFTVSSFVLFRLNTVV